MADPLQAGNAAWQAGNLPLAEQRFRQALSLDQNDVAATTNLVAVLCEQHRQPEALEIALAGIRQHPASTSLLCNIGILYASGGASEPAMAYLRHALDIDPDYSPASLNLANAMLHGCDWSGIEKFQADILSRRASAANAPGHANWQERLLPYGAVQMGLPAPLQKEIADFHADKIRAAWPPIAPGARRPGNGKLRIGYLSSDFHDHATAFLASAYLSRHDRDRFSVFCYSFGPIEGSAYAQRIRESANAFRDIRGLGHATAAQTIRDDQIDMLVDLKGHTGGGRPEIVALRPAPIVVNFLGHPGTLGGSLADVIIGDRIVTPAAHARFFSERVVCVDDCYQPNERLEPLPAPPPRASLGLPADGFVYCCLNAPYKISRTTFAAWMQILRATPSAVLWLLDSSPYSTARLRDAAASMGIEPARLRFAPVVDHPTHLVRLQAADLFLDTEGVCAHTLASDALRAGIPLLALPGESFASRVSSSLLATAGLDELSCSGRERYVELAIGIARNPDIAASLRGRVRSGAQRSTLFDPEHFCRKFEAALAALAPVPVAASC
jgi:predicted O-linked N-acetylglucosamine transferase (SPINDLY family)